MHHRATFLHSDSPIARVIFPLIAGAVMLASTTLGCASQSVQRWGSMREVLHEGRTEGRVQLADFNGVDDMVAVGALEGLSGEVVIVDGDVWLSRVNDLGQANTTRGAARNDRATLLTAAHVTQWREILIDHDVPASEVETFLIDAARVAGFNPKKTVPFMVTGALVDIKLHIIAGVCPLAASHGRAKTTLRQPLRKSWETSSARLVGFLTENQEGVMTHHGSIMHTHVLVDIDPPVMGHLDRVGFTNGCVLYFPKR